LKNKIIGAHALLERCQESELIAVIAINKLQKEIPKSSQMDLKKHIKLLQTREEFVMDAITDGEEVK